MKKRKEGRSKRVEVENKKERKKCRRKSERWMRSQRQKEEGKIGRKGLVGRGRE